MCKHGLEAIVVATALLLVTSGAHAQSRQQQIEDSCARAVLNFGYATGTMKKAG